MSDGCVLRVLDQMMVLGGERLSYRTLDVEQIGSVYETVMGFTVEPARAPMLAIRAGKNNKVPVWVDLAALAGAGGAERAKLLKDWTGRSQLPAAVAQGVEGCDVGERAGARRLRRSSTRAPRREGRRSGRARRSCSRPTSGGGRGAIIRRAR